MILNKQKGDLFLGNVGQAPNCEIKLAPAELFNWLPTQSAQCIQIVSVGQSYTGLWGGVLGGLVRKWTFLLKGGRQGESGMVKCGKP